MKPSQLTRILGSLLERKWPVFLWGPPGVGKSSIVKRVAEEKGLEIMDVRASLLDPTDLRGIPYVEEGIANWAPPAFLPSKPDGKGILFFDELNAAPPLVQASLYQLTLDRRIGEYVLPDGWKIVAAGNRAEDRSIVFRMPNALSNRFTHLDFEVDYEDWRIWAIDRGIHPMIVGFLGLRRELLFRMEERNRAFPTPRSWEILSDHLFTLGTELIDEISVGTVGEATAIEFMGYLQNGLDEKRAQKILDDPENAEIPDDLGNLYALASHICSRASEKKVRSGAGRLLFRLPKEISVLIVRDLLRITPSFAAEDSCDEFLRENERLLA